MPRRLGVGNADTIQQRARFLGYKRPYLGYCRVFVGRPVADAYSAYVEHEEDIRSQLLDTRERDMSLVDWKRAFFLSPNLRPTRSNVLDLDYMHGQFSNDWFSARKPWESDDITDSNRITVERFLETLTLTPDLGHTDRTAVQRHLTATASLESVYANLLTELRVTDPTDSQRFTGALLQIRAYLESRPEAGCQVYVISPDERRYRTISDAGEITNLFQGAYPVEPLELRGSVYPGDSSIRAEQGVTVQIHRIEIRQGSSVVNSDVPVVAVWIPSELARSWLVQEAQGSCDV